MDNQTDLSGSPVTFKYPFKFSVLIRKSLDSHMKTLHMIYVQ